MRHEDVQNGRPQSGVGLVLVGVLVDVLDRSVGPVVLRPRGALTRPIRIIVAIIVVIAATVVIVALRGVTLH